jgi:hypothetical protein
MLVTSAEEWRLSSAGSVGTIGQFMNEWEGSDENKRFDVEGAHFHSHRL